MLRPGITSRVKQQDFFTTMRDSYCLMCRFMQRARHTSERQILAYCRPTSGPRDKMIDMESRFLAFWR
jgi:hypothetical protein